MFLPVIKQQVKVLADAARSHKMMRYFKTGSGEYSEGDTFIGLTNLECRRIAATNRNASFEEVEKLLVSNIHEERLIGLVILAQKLKQNDLQDEVYEVYLRNLKAVNNWNLVDISAPQIMGNYIFKRCKSFKELTGSRDPRSILYKLASSNVLWERRISILSTLTFIKQGQYYDSLLLSSKLLKDKESLIQKAVGWMLREVGKR
jgi:3-methyladenine DNA glycosylase AlkD